MVHDVFHKNKLLFLTRSFSSFGTEYILMNHKSITTNFPNSVVWNRHLTISANPFHCRKGLIMCGRAMTMLWSWGSITPWSQKRYNGLDSPNFAVTFYRHRSFLGFLSFLLDFSTKPKMIFLPWEFLRFSLPNIDGQQKPTRTTWLRLQAPPLASRLEWWTRSWTQSGKGSKWMDPQVESRWWWWWWWWWWWGGGGVG